MPTAKSQESSRKPLKPKVTTTKSKSRARPSREPRVGPVNQWLELRRSGIHGLGGFARKRIPKGTRIIEYVGEHITNAEADRRYDDETPGDHHTFLFVLNSKVCIDASFQGNESRFINHSCGPNCDAEIARGHIWIVALRDIEAGEELAYDYAYDNDPKYTDKDLLHYVCHCGAPNCRGTIVDTKRLMRK